MNYPISLLSGIFAGQLSQSTAPFMCVIILPVFPQSLISIFVIPQVIIVCPVPPFEITLNGSIFFQYFEAMEYNHQRVQLVYMSACNMRFLGVAWCALPIIILLRSLSNPFHCTCSFKIMVSFAVPYIQWQTIYAENSSVIYSSCDNGGNEICLSCRRRWNILLARTCVFDTSFPWPFWSSTSPTYFNFVTRGISYFPTIMFVYFSS